MGGVFPKSDQTRQGCDQRSCSADVHTEQQAAVVVCESRQQNRRGNVADDLTGCDTDQKLAFCHQIGEQAADQGNSGHVSCENEKANKGQKQGIVHGAERFSVGEKQTDDDQDQADIIGDHAEDHDDGEGK